MTETVSREQKVLDAALALFLKNGIRGTSMEAIAADAGIAKPTLYKLFADKQAVFDAVARRIFGDLRAEIAAAGTAGGEPVARAANMLSAKHKYIFRLLGSSPHADELYAAPKSALAEDIAALETWLLGEVANCLAEAGIAGPEKLAAILNACAHGIANHAAHGAEIGPAIRLVTERVCAGAVD